MGQGELPDAGLQGGIVAGTGFQEKSVEAQVTIAASPAFLRQGFGAAQLQIAHIVFGIIAGIVCNVVVDCCLPLRVLNAKVGQYFSNLRQGGIFTVDCQVKEAVQTELEAPTLFFGPDTGSLQRTTLLFMQQAA